MLISRRRGDVAELRREIADDEDVVRLGHFSRVFVVLLDRGELVPEVLLEHVLHVLGQVGEAGLDVPGSVQIRLVTRSSS